MSEEERQQDDLDQNWQRVDARILGQLLAAQNLLFVLPDETRIAEFFSEALSRVPGVTSCFICLGDRPAPVDAAGEICGECVTLRRKEGGMSVMPPHISCGWAARQDLRVIPLSTAEHTFGFFILQTDSSGVIEPYWPFLTNLANYVALSLENRMQKHLLEQARDELEDRVRTRTEELRQMNERFSLATRAARLGVWDWDLQKNELVWNDGMYELYGVKKEDFAGAYEAWLQGVHPDDRAFSDEISRQARRGERPYDTEFRVVWPDNSIHYLKAYGQFVRDGDGKPLRMTGINYDITERKRAGEEVHRLNQELEQRVADRTAQLEAANKELEAFASSVSHDLRAPLRHIDGFLELLEKRTTGALDERSQHYMNTISDAAERMGVLIDDLLAFSRMGRHEMSKGPVELGLLVQDIIREYESETKNRLIHWHIVDLPAVTGDRAMLRIVLVNLIANALKFTRQRQPAEITIGCLPDQGNEIVIFVRDNGVGFDMVYIDKLFGVFQRLHQADEFEGTGIGLANVRRIINRHGGRTWAEGKVNQGATFYFSLPHIIQET
jgi:PAS domain S-box-containing protein